MASELAQAVAKRHLETIVTVGAIRLMANVDAELQEVREIVELIAHPKFKAAESGVQYYVTKSDVEAARFLLSKLRVEPRA